MTRKPILTDTVALRLEARTLRQLWKLRQEDETISALIRRILLAHLSAQEEDRRAHPRMIHGGPIR